MNKYKLTFKLKQHTPIIHFQHNQEGATLRASELKPKLDKFLIEKLGGKDVLKKKHPNWFISTEHPALDYKITLAISNKNSYFMPLPIKLDSKKFPNKSDDLKKFVWDKLDIDISFIAPSPYFANADKIKFEGSVLDTIKTDLNNLRVAIFSEDTINAKITTFIPNLEKRVELIEKLKNHLEEFFLVHNFGTRQNKGFGSYTVTEINNTKVKDTKTYDLIKKNFILKSNQKQNSFNHIFKFIVEEYQLLKNGKNLSFLKPPIYNKSKMFEYFCDKGIRWEKRFLKKQINAKPILSKKLFYQYYPPIDFDDFSKIDYNDYTDRQKNDYKYVRALLGLAEHYEFLVDNGRGGKERNKYIVKVKHVTSSSSKIVERFKSPILFKVIDNDIYLKADDTHKDIEGEKFEFMLEYQGNKGVSHSLGQLQVPTNFDIIDFINKKKSRNWKNI